MSDDNTMSLAARALVEQAKDEESGWVIESHFASQLHYWTGKPNGWLGAWDTSHGMAVRFARRTDAECMPSWHLQDMGRVVFHIWRVVPPAPLEAQSDGQ